MGRQIHKDNTSGQVILLDTKIFWHINDKNIVQIDSDNIAVIGEYTTEEGPWFDDWFLAFVDKSGIWQSISMYSDCIDRATQFLSDKFEMDLTKTHLAASTVWCSYVTYPLHLTSKAIFKLTEGDNYKAPKNYLNKLQYALGLGDFDTSRNIDLTDEIKAYLNSVSL
jgi:hypothetical protein